MNRMRKRMDKVQDFADNLSRDLYDEFVKNTPVRTGNARRSTRLKRDRIISAEYGYAQQLEGAKSDFGTRKGTSKQAPNGMAEPSIKHIRKKFRAL